MAGQDERVNYRRDQQPAEVQERGRRGRRGDGNGDSARMMVTTAILVSALFAFELFNFDTTRFALNHLLGDVTFAGIKWGAVLAVAFCGIDFAGLIRIFMGESEKVSKEEGYLIVAWFLGATMNAGMTWYATLIVLLGHEIGNEVVSRETLLQYVPIFIAVLVWLTRVLFIGTMTLIGGKRVASD